MGEHPDINLEQIIRGCRAKKRIDQRRLYELYYAYGMSICMRYSRNEDDAIEILNDSFMKVFKNIKKYNSQQPFKPWFRRILINTSINHIKKNEKFKRHESMENHNNIVSADDILSRISYQEMIQMVQSLSTAYRTVFNMYVIDGFKHDEIAKALGISTGTSKSNLAKAKAKLREIILRNLNRYA
ncbi:MAG: RNA polymerase sigma factor [Flammeovirgaceae bacterium]